MSRYLDFMRSRLGANWVLARRTARVVRKYGEDVNCVSRQRYAAIEREYRALYGDPHDNIRAQMYRALLAAREELRNPTGDSAILVDVELALEAERNR